MSTAGRPSTDPPRTDPPRRAPSATPAPWPAASAATRSSSARTTRVRSASARSRSPTTSRAVTREQIEAGPPQHLALQGAAAGARRHRPEPQHRARLHPAAAGRQPRPRARHRQPLGQGRLHQPDQLLQGPRRRLRAERRPRARRARCSPVPSTGNLANAVAAAGARAGIKTVVFIPADLEQPKQVNSAVYTENLVAVNGNYDDVNRLASEIAGEEEGWAFVNVNVRPVLRRGLQDAGLRDRRAARLAAARPDRHPGGLRLAADQGRQGVPGADRARPRRGQALPGVRRAGHGLLAGLARRTRTAPTRSARSSRTPSPRAWRSATRPTASTCSTSAAAPAAPSRTSPTTRSARASCCWPAPRASSPRPPAAPPSACLKKLVETGQLDPTLETVVINTGMGLKTLDAVADSVGPAATIDPSYAAFTATGIA